MSMGSVVAHDDNAEPTVNDARIKNECLKSGLFGIVLMWALLPSWGDSSVRETQRLRKLNPFLQVPIIRDCEEKTTRAQICESNEKVFLVFDMLAS
jgi:hypothetical protein